MSTKKEFQKVFSENNLKKIYQEKIIHTKSCGIDCLSQKNYMPRLEAEIDIISRKVSSENYKFTKYKLQLINKGRGKVPREILIPTIRDRITLKALCDLLSKTYENIINDNKSQDIIKLIKEKMKSNLYDSFIKLDIKNFYPNVRHEELIKILKSKVRHPPIISLINNAVKTPTVLKSSPCDSLNETGIPQGLSISNILSSIYLINIDKKFSLKNDLVYFRYVDDILILCNYRKLDETINEITYHLEKIGLKIHDPKESNGKSVIGKITSPFAYLGYQFSGDIITVRKESVDKFRESILNIFTSFKYSEKKSIPYLVWKLNLRITGCVYEKKTMGWLFYFSEINDEKLLHQLDYFIEMIAKRFGVSCNFSKLVRAYFEIKHKKYQTSYIPNFDKLCIDQKKHLLENIFSKDVSKMSNERINFEFDIKLDQQVEELEADVKKTCSQCYQ